METIIFYIWNYNDMCRITTNNCLQEIKNICDEACIMSLDVFLHEINYITKECQKLGYKAIFETA